MATIQKNIQKNLSSHKDKSMTDKKRQEKLDPFIEKYYSKGHEKDRLASHQLERDRTLSILKRYLPKAPATILDIGGGAGAYAFPLTEMGYRTFD